MSERASGRRRRFGSRLYSRILVSQIAVLIVAMGLGFGLFARSLQGNLYSSYEHDALTVAEMTAADPRIQAAMAAGDPGHVVATLAEQMRQAAGASYVVVIDRHGIRHSHPDPALIGQAITEPVVALDGRDHVGIDHGNLGLSANGKAPLRAPDGRIIGEVSAGIAEKKVSATLMSNLPSLILYAVLAVGVGAAASLALTRRLKRETFGLELDEIAALLQEREATLYGIREGVVAADPQGRVSLINDEARKLLGAPGIHPRQPLVASLPEGRLRDLLSDPSRDLVDEPVFTDERALVVNRKAVRVGGTDLGSVITLRDRTAVVGLLGELNGIRNFADALRAQQHEHANRMHVVAGLLELGRPEEAAAYLSEVSATAAGIAETLKDGIGDPTVVALVLAKIAMASERGVRLEVEAGGSALDGGEVDPGLVVTVLGNLVDNAIDAVAGQGPEPGVKVSLTTDPDRALVIEVADNGPGVADPVMVFADGYSTKASVSGQERGMGLALVQKLVRRQGGEIVVHNRGGAVFTVTLPVRARHPVHRL